MTEIETIFNLFNLHDQCCDANSYLRFGKICALTNECYHDIRPMGSLLWFSIPYRLNMPPNLLIALHFLLTFLSSFFAFKLIKNNTSLTNAAHLHKTRNIVLFLTILIAHFIFLYPFIFNTLSDVPAALFFLIGIWLLNLSAQTKHKIILSSLAGLFLGLSCWIRAFYLYPVLLGLSMLFISCIIQKRIIYLFSTIPIALLPLLIQYAISYNQPNGTFSYINKNEKDFWENVHLSNNSSGYDTILPRNYYYWPLPCGNEKGILEAITSIDIPQVSCIFYGRLKYYLGSYSYFCYIPAINNFLKDESFNKISFTKRNNTEYFFVHQIESGWDYSLSIFLKSQHPNQPINLSIYDPYGKKIASMDRLIDNSETDNEKYLHQLNFHAAKSGLYTFIIGESIFINQLKHYAKNKNYMEITIKDPVLSRQTGTAPNERIWSNGLFLLNLVCIFSVLTIFFRKFDTKKTAENISFLLIASCVPISLTIIPEQRFFLAIHIFIWVKFIEIVFSLKWKNNILSKTK